MKAYWGSGGMVPRTRLRWVVSSMLRPLYRGFEWRAGLIHIRGCIQKFPDWPPGARTANGTALCHYVQLCSYFVSQSSEFWRHNPSCCVLTSNTKCKRIFRYQLSSETFGYTHVDVTFTCLLNSSVPMTYWNVNCASFQKHLIWISKILIYLWLLCYWSEVHPASCTVDTGGSFPVVKLTTHLHLLPRLRIHLSYTSTPSMRLHDVVFS